MMKPTVNAIVIKDLNFSINHTEILRNINLTVDKGEFIGLIGPNGAGKTSLLKCINRINKASGNIALQNKDLKSMKDKEVAREVSLMHQASHLTSPFPAIDVVLMGRYPHLKRMEGESKQDFEIARRNMAYTDTLKFERIPITEMSGGERQRVLFAKVLTQSTELVLLDEPTASLDITHQEQIFKYSKELCENGKTVIAAVHDLKIASRYCSKLVLMKDGEILSKGTPDEVLTRENLSLAYGVNALVYRNKITGLLDFHIHDQSELTSKMHIHVIGGGGSASAVIRQLFEKGYRISTGVLSIGDSDVQCAEVFGIDRLVCQPFSDISEETHEQNVALVRSADATILCNMPFGKQNLKNLEAAGFAERLVIIEDDSPDGRDFSGGEALEFYKELKNKAVVTTTARFHEVL